MLIKTTRFGDVEADSNLIFEFISPIIGFDDAKHYILIENGNNNVFRWLQSVEFPELAFPVSNASNFKIDYNFEIDDQTVEELSLKSVEEVLTLNIVNIPKGEPQHSTINLLAPIIINKSNRKGLQMILNGSDYLVKQALFPEGV